MEKPGHWLVWVNKGVTVLFSNFRQMLTDFQHYILSSKYVAEYNKVIAKDPITRYTAL